MSLAPPASSRSVLDAVRRSSRLQKRASASDSESRSNPGSRAATPVSTSRSPPTSTTALASDGRPPRPPVADESDGRHDDVDSRREASAMSSTSRWAGALCSQIHPSPKKHGDIEEDLLLDAEEEDKPRRLCARLVTIDQAPEWQVYKFVHRGYRLHYGFFDCIASAFTLHNETLNVWTHLLPFFFFAYRAVEVAGDSRYMSGAAWQDTVAFLVFLVSACVCFFNSAVFHLFNCCSEEIHDTLFSVDIIGIIVLIAGSFVPGLTYGFYCEGWARRIYLFAICSLSFAAAVMPFISSFQKPEYKGVRAAILGGLAISGVLPCIHWFVIKGPHGIEVEMFLSGVLSMYAYYGLGFVVYLSHAPERFFPGWFDYAFHSHNIWHLLVCAAAATWHETMALYMHWRHEHSCNEIPAPH